MADPFKEPNVTLAFVLTSGAAVGPFTVKRNAAVEFIKEYNSRSGTAKNNAEVLAHTIGVLSVDLNQVAIVTVVAGSTDAVPGLVELVA